MKNKNEINYIDPFSILVVNRNGELGRIHCPFAVRCIAPVENIKVGMIVSVEMIAVELTNQIHYRIKGKYLLHIYFELKTYY